MDSKRVGASCKSNGARRPHAEEICQSRFVYRSDMAESDSCRCVEWPEDGAGARWQPDNNSVYLQGIGRVKATVHRPVIGRVKTIQIRGQGRHWMLILSCDDVPLTPLPSTGRQIGVDVGIANFATTSDGDRLPNPRWARTSATRLATAQKRLAEKKRGSNNRGAARQTVASRHRKIANQRRDFHHETARAFVAPYDLIAVEDLAIANLLRRAKPVPDPDPGQFLRSGAAAKAGLNRSIADAGWGQFIFDTARQSGARWAQLVRSGPQAHLRPL